MPHIWRCIAIDNRLQSAHKKSTETTRRKEQTKRRENDEWEARKQQKSWEMTVRFYLFSFMFSLVAFLFTKKRKTKWTEPNLKSIFSFAGSWEVRRNFSRNWNKAITVVCCCTHAINCVRNARRRNQHEWKRLSPQFWLINMKSFISSLVFFFAFLKK